MSVDQLSDESYQQTLHFQKFFRSKREVALEQIQCDFDDTKNDSVVEDIFTKEEVSETPRARSEANEAVSNDPVGATTRHIRTPCRGYHLVK